MLQENNFDFLRIVFAIFVIVTHAYPLSGSLAYDWISQISFNQMSFSYLGVAGFFAISGYLVMQSLSRSKSLKEYFLKRILRIYPALAVVLIVTVLLGVFVYDGTLLNYIENTTTWTYIPYNLLLFKMQYSINGVFGNNSFKSVINGSLSTLPYEMFFYILIASLFFIKRKMQRIFLLVIAFSLVMFLKIFIYPYLISHGYASYWRRGIDYSGGFIAGALLALFKVEKVNCKSTLLFIAILIWVVSILFHFYIWMQYFVWPLAVVIIGTSATGVIKNIKSRIGDLSYGIYIYAFPIQQTLEHFFKLSYIPLMFLGVIITLPFAFFS